MINPVRTLGTITCLLGAAAAVWLASAMFMDVSMAGFPDGHLTDYSGAIDIPLQVVMWAAVVFTGLFVGLSFSPVRSRLRGIALPVAVIAFVALVFVAEMGIPWYYGTYLGLDNGIGG